jgi:hypothetical protein
MQATPGVVLVAMKVGSDRAKHSIGGLIKRQKRRWLCCGCRLDRSTAAA